MNTFSLPDDWRQLPSKVDGIQVWGPCDGADKDAPEGGYRCEKCGGGISFEIARGAAACGWCDHVAVTASDVGQRARSDVFSEETIARATQGWALQRKELHCDGCGVDLAVEQGDLATSCSFCGSNQVLLRESAVQSLRPNAMITFQFDEEWLPARIRRWLGSGWIHPSNLSSTSLLASLTPIYMPFWTFEATARTRWSALVGTVERGRGRDSQSRTSWKRRSGTFDQRLANVTEPGTQRLQRSLVLQICDYGYNQLKDYDPALLAGWRAQAYDIGLTEAWDRGRQRMRETVKGTARSAAGGDKVRAFHVQANLDEERWRYVLLPVYVGAYRYQGRVYNIVVNGQTGTIAGQRPVAWWKVWAVSGLFFLPGILTTLISLPLLLLGGVGLLGLFFALIFFILAGAGAASLFRMAFRAEART
ncbi:MAG: hypothetical protein EA397_09465 [Deltaproteobacteria bacterium]|nr:MAG: hypothetical protein EA397_09465 [Deltaproteobacteria bacterium]